jgi:hypothetical protein
VLCLHRFRNSDSPGYVSQKVQKSKRRGPRIIKYLGCQLAESCLVLVAWQAWEAQEVGAGFLGKFDWFLDSALEALHSKADRIRIGFVL